MSGFDPRLAARDAFDPQEGVREARETHEKLKAAVQTTKDMVGRAKDALRATEALLRQLPDRN